jgi:hypothetical protein
VLHLLFGSPSKPHSELVSIADQLDAACSLLGTSSQPADAAQRARHLAHQAVGLRQKLEARLARAGAHMTDPRLICQAAAELIEVMRLVGRVIRGRQWLRGDAGPAELVELDAMAVRRVQLVATTAWALGTSGRCHDGPEAGHPMRAEAQELYARGMAAAFAQAPDPVEVLRRKAVYELLLGVVLGSDRALEAMQAASPQ